MTSTLDVSAMRNTKSTKQHQLPYYKTSLYHSKYLKFRNVFELRPKSWDIIVVHVIKLYPVTTVKQSQDLPVHNASSYFVNVRFSMLHLSDGFTNNHLLHYDAGLARWPATNYTKPSSITMLILFLACYDIEVANDVLLIIMFRICKQLQIT